MDRLSPHSPNTGTKPQTFGRARPNRALGGHGAAGRLGLGLGRPLQLRVSSDSLENEEFIREAEEGVNHSGGKEEIRHRRDGTTISMTSTTRSQQLQGTNIASDHEDPSGDFQRQLRTHSRYPHSTTSITLSPSNPLTFQLGGNYGTRGTPIFVQVMVTPPSPAQRYDVDSRNSLLD
ncbi:hypothetical protein BDN72DRAFT_836130 [Pluteus cervinus]|uniref:Uncharacterized protein n=1 Tax=Pluteus cervinus TaxID=181527 RepID=A0ACD3B3L3_9AGAR|nr:hypothetical protein BDN72DRAFT_836130 [Pluteus cervinus]